MSANPLKQAATLRKTALFSGLSDKVLDRLAACAFPRRFAKRQVIFSEGEPCRGLYVVESGFVKIFKTSARGREQVLSIEGPGATVAELPVFDGGNYPASAAAETEALLLFIGKKEFQSVCLEHPEAAMQVLKVVGKRLRQLVDLIERISFTTVRRRLVALLSRLAREKGRPTPHGIEFTLTITNQQLSAQIGTVRELVSRTMSRLQVDGIIRVEGRTVIVPDPEALHSEAEEPD